MTFDINNPEHRSTICSILNRQTGGGVWIVPKPIRDGEPLPSDYEFTMEDFVIPEGFELPDLATLSEELETEIEEAHWGRARTYRNTLLSDTDNWTAPDRTMTPEQIAYRQALRDVPQTHTDPIDITWPEKP
jgi:hypothetical protein